MRFLKAKIRRMVDPKVGEKMSSVKECSCAAVARTSRERAAKLSIF